MSNSRSTLFSERFLGSVTTWVGFSKVNQLGGGRFQSNGQLHPKLEVQICSSCGDEVENVIWLSNEQARLSSGLKNRIYETRQEKGDGLNSAWGQTRLEALLMMTVSGGKHQHQLYRYHDLQENVKPEGSCPPSDAAETVGSYVGEPEDNSQEPRANSVASDQNKAADDERKSDAECPNDSLFEEKYGNVIIPIPGEAEESNSDEEPSSTRSSVSRRSTGTRVSSTKSLDTNFSQHMELEVSSGDEDHLDSDQSDSHNQGAGNKSISWRKRQRQPDGRYHCLFCSETFLETVTVRSICPNLFARSASDVIPTR